MYTVKNDIFHPSKPKKKENRYQKKINKQAQVFFLSLFYLTIITSSQLDTYLFRCIEKFFIRSRFLGRYEPIQTDPNWHKLTYTPGANDGNQSKWQLSNLYKENDQKKNILHWWQDNGRKWYYFFPKKSNNYLLMVIYFIFVTNPQITLIHFVQPYTEFVKRSNHELILRVN